MLAGIPWHLKSTRDVSDGITIKAHYPQEDDLQHLQFFTHYGKLVEEEQEGPILVISSFNLKLIRIFHGCCYIFSISFFVLMAHI